MSSTSASPYRSDVCLQVLQEHNVSVFAQGYTTRILMVAATFYCIGFGEQGLKSRHVFPAPAPRSRLFVTDTFFLINGRTNCFLLPETFFTLEHFESSNSGTASLPALYFATLSKHPLKYYTAIYWTKAFFWAAREQKERDRYRSRERERYVFFSLK